MSAKSNEVELSSIEKETSLPSRDITDGFQDQTTQITTTQRQTSLTQSQASITSERQISLTQSQTSITSERQISLTQSQTSITSERQVSLTLSQTSINSERQASITRSQSSTSIEEKPTSLTRSQSSTSIEEKQTSLTLNQASVNSHNPVPIGFETQKQISEAQIMHEKVHPHDEIKNADADQVERLNNNVRLAKKKTDSYRMALIKKKVTIMTIISFFLIIIGLTTGILWPSLFNNILSKQLVLAVNSTTYKMWQETPVPMYLKIYMYNWTNYRETEKENAKPHFVELGPYVFREVDHKVNQKWDYPKNGTVTFNQMRVWHFEPKLSNGALTDEVTNLNPVAATMAYLMRNKNDFFKRVITRVLKSLESIVITKPVHELLFDGYDDKLLKLAYDLGVKDIPFERFAYFYDRNNSIYYDGTFVMNTGRNNIDELGIIEEWHSNSTLKFPTSCGLAKGSNGDLWPPLPNNETVSVLSPDVCDTVSLKADGKSEWLGITGNKYSSHEDMFEDMFENGTRIPTRRCHCQGVECQPSGTLNVSSCKFGAPAFISLPHFYLADTAYRQNISGMRPNKEDHEFKLVVQPDTGVPMQVRAGLQLNFLVRPDTTLSYFKNLPYMYVPMIWFTQEVNLTSEYANQVKLILIVPPAVSGILYSLAAIGILLAAIAVFLYVRQRIRDGENERLVPKDSQSRNKVPDIVIDNEE